MVILTALSAQAKVEVIRLSNHVIAAEITPDIGGRLLSFHLQNKPNFLKVGDAVLTDPDPVVTPEAKNISYFGHEVWVGPQSQWWQQQFVNEERRTAKAIWPPDPYLILAKNKTLDQNALQVILQSPQSPVSGVTIKKTYRLVEENPNQLKLDVEATNICNTEIAWDIWFNSRVPHLSQVYVPVASMSDVRIAHFSDATYDGLTHSFGDGIFALENTISMQKQGRKGKVFIQPSQGWMAAFRGDQMLLIQFALQAKSAIHPEQGQIELYQEFLHAEPEAGLLELELHAPYKVLSPGASMSATEIWTLLPYGGAGTRDAQIEFLRQLNVSGGI